ncbi:MAG: hypothetical protein E7233_09820 [Lachnospiraceae bacterium]|nr:hypothetical protein [Lachnospiraceae bacterium]
MKQFLKYLLYAAIFIAAVYLITVLFGDFQTSVKFGKDDALTLTGPRKTSVTVAYDDIESIELITLADPGEKVDGGSSRSYYWGTWKNEEYGEYKLFVSKKTPAAILVKTNAGEIIIFNQGDTVTTENTYKLFGELLDNRT